MLTSDTPEVSQPQPASPLIGRLCRISTTPARPTTSPAHCSGVTRSPNQRLAMVEVRIGWRPGISAERPAGMEMRDRDRRPTEIKSVHQNAGYEAVGNSDPGQAIADALCRR